MLLDASSFHAGSFAPAFSDYKVHPVYRLPKTRLRQEQITNLLEHSTPLTKLVFRDHWTVLKLKMRESFSTNLRDEILNMNHEIHLFGLLRQKQTRRHDRGRETSDVRRLLHRRRPSPRQRPLGRWRTNSTCRNLSLAKTRNVCEMNDKQRPPRNMLHA